MNNPDVAEVVAQNARACAHPVIDSRSVPVGRGYPVLGCHMERRDFCRDCGAAVPGLRLSRLMQGGVR